MTARENDSLLQVGKLQIAVPLRGVTELHSEVVRLKGGAPVGVLRLMAAQQQAAVLVVERRHGDLEHLWTGMLQFAGDPGERRADGLEIADRDGDGAPDVLVGTYDEQVGMCGQDRTLLAPRAVDPSSLRLRSVLLNRTATRPVTEQLMASTAPAVPAPPPLLRALRVVSVSSASSDPAHAASAAGDGDLSTSWVEGRGLGGRFEFVSLHWAAENHPIVALAVVPVPTGADPKLAARPRVLSILGPHGEHLVATLPEDPKPGQRYFIVPKQPLDWSCLTVAIDDVYASDLGPKTHAALAEIEAYAEIDRSGGLAQLVRELAEPGARGDDATALLANARGDVSDAVATAWPTLSALGKRRALRLLFRGPNPNPDPHMLEVLRQALRDSDAELNAQALELARHVAGAGTLVLELARSATPEGDRAALAMARDANADTLETFLAALVDARGTERPALRDALGEAYRKLGAAAADGVIRSWLERPPAPKPVAARAALALALANVPEGRAQSAALVRGAYREAGEFPDQWRLVEAAAELGSEPEIDAWLAQLAARADPWMLRERALTALRARDPVAALRCAHGALKDTYPRVRATALETLAKSGSELDLVARFAEGDKWFLVRRAALESLPRGWPRARTVLSSALHDRTPAVRAAAIRGLSRNGASDAWPELKPLLENPEEYPEVIAEGIAFARGLCVSAAAPSLQQVVKRGLKPEAWSADQDLALGALETLSRLGGQSAVWARDHAVGPLVPAELQRSAAQAVAKPVACQPDAAL